MKARLADLVARALVPVARLVARLPRPVLRMKLQFAEALLRGIDREHPALGPLAEVREIVERDPVGLAAIRRILLEGRRGQVVAVLRGMLLHRAFAAPVVADFSPRLAKLARTGEPLTVAIVGDTDDTRLLRAAYAGVPGCRIAEATAAARIIEVADPEAAGEEEIAETLRRGAAVSLHPAALPSPDGAARLMETARRSGAALRVFYPVLDYPPLAKVRALLAADAIGEVATVRVRAIVGGSGGALPPVPPDDADPFAHPAFDHFALLAALGGEIAAATAYRSPMTGGGAALVAVRYAHPGRTGVLEVVHAPEMVIPSRHRPYDLEAEIAGTDGILWLRRGMAKRTQVPAVEVRVGTRWLRIGVGSGLPEDWEDAHRAAASGFVARVRGIAPATLGDAALLSALRARAIAGEATDRADVIEFPASGPRP
jgi:hypothetical protein